MKHKTKIDIFRAVFGNRRARGSNQQLNLYNNLVSGHPTSRLYNASDRLVASRAELVDTLANLLPRITET